MNWKEFLKPSWEKIVLTVALPVLFYCAIFSIGTEPMIYSPLERLIMPVGFISFFTVFPLFIPLAILYGILRIDLDFHNIFALFGFAIYSYLLSCVIISIYNKVKKDGITIDKSEMFVYIFWLLTFIGSLTFPTFYTPIIIGIIAIYFAEKVKKRDKNKGNVLIIISVIILIINVVITMSFWSSFFSNILDKGKITNIEKTGYTGVTTTYIPTSKRIQLLNANCDKNNMIYQIKNIGIADVDADSIFFNVDRYPVNITCDPPLPIKPDKITTCNNSATIGPHNIIIIGPSNVVEANLECK